MCLMRGLISLDLIGNKTTKMPSKLYTVSVLLIFRAFLKALLYKGFTYFRLSLIKQKWDMKSR